MKNDVVAAFALPKRFADYFSAILRSTRNRAARLIPALFVAAMMVLGGGEAFAQSIVSVTPNPTTYSAAGQTINFTYVYNTGSSAFGTLTVSDNGLPSLSGSCPSGNNQTGQTVTCTGSYVTKASDIPIPLVSIPVFHLNDNVTTTYNGNIQIAYTGGGPVAQPTTTSLSGSPNPSTFGQNVNFTATVTGSSPTGTVTFKDGNTTLGTTNVNSGQATLGVSSLSVGPHTISATYSGDSANLTSSGTASQTVNQATQSITFSTPPDTAFSSAPPALTASASSGLTVSYASNSTGVCTVSGSTISFVSVGSCSITASQAGNGNVAAATPVTRSFNVTTGANTITFNTPADTPFTSAPPALTASASSGLAVSYASNSTGVCTVSGSAISFVSVGSCSITASQAGNSNFAAATPVTRAFNVTAGANTITFNAPADTAFTSAPPALTATASSGLAVSYASNSGGICTVSGSTITFVSVGSCSITASQAGGGNFAAATPVTRSFNVTPGVNTITFNAPADTAFTSAPPALTATASSGLAVSYASNSAGVCTVAGSTISFVSVGSCSITASQAGGGNYAAATPVTRSFNVTAGVNTITFNAPADTPFTSAPPTLTATASSGLAVSYASNSGGFCTVSGSTITFVSAGSCSITASQAGGGNYAAATPVTRSFNVMPGVNTITFNAPADTPFTSAPPALTATASSGLAVSYASNTTGVCTVSGSTITFVSGGSCSITATQAGNGNFAAATPVTRSFNVTQGVNTITFSAPADTPFTSPPPALTATASSGLAVSYASNTSGVCTVSGSSITFVSAGSCSITATQAGNVSYVAATPVTRSFNVTPGVNVITFGALQDRAYGSGSFTVSANASSGLAVAFASGTPATCGVSGSTVTLLAVGQCTVTATQPGNNNFQAATPVSQSFTINKAVTSVALSSTGSTAFFGVPVTLTATVAGVSPTGTVTFRDGGATIATVNVSGGQASFTTKSLTVGSHTITATYNGDASNATSVSSGLTITVNTRPDPSLDPNVRAIVNAQVTAAQRFAETQIDNITQRLERLHDDDDPDPVTMGLGFSDGTVPPAASAFQDPAQSNGYIAYNGAQRGINSAFPPAPPRARKSDVPLHIWMSGAVSFGRASQFGVIDNKFTTSGLTFGVDTKLMDGFKAGVSFGFGRDETKIGTDGTKTEATNVNVAVYGSYKLMPKTFLDVIAGYGSGSIDSLRFAAAGNVYVQGNRKGHQLFGSLALVREEKWGALKLSPYLRVDMVRIGLDPYTEVGSPIWALSFQQLNTQTLRGVIGLRTGYDIPMSWGTLTLLSRFEYRARFSGAYNQNLSYADLIGGTVYTITDQALSNNQMMMALGLRATTDTVGVDVEYQLSAANSRVQSHTFRGAVRVGF